MPVVKHLLVEVIQSENRAPFKEYAIMHKNGSNTITCFIESSDEQKFDIRFTPTKGFPLHKYPIPLRNYPLGENPEDLDEPFQWVIDVTIDGAPKPQLGVFLKIPASNPDGESKVLMGPRAPVPGRTGVSYQRQWAFSDVSKTTAGVTAALESLSFDTGKYASIDHLGSALSSATIQGHDESNTKQGSIRVEVYRQLIHEEDRQAVPRLLVDPSANLEKDITHLTEVVQPQGKPIREVRDTLFKTFNLETDRVPFAVFIFYYRSSEKLIQFGIKEPIKRESNDIVPLPKKRPAPGTDGKPREGLMRSIAVRIPATSKDPDANGIRTAFQNRSKQLQGPVKSNEQQVQQGQQTSENNQPVSPIEELSSRISPVSPVDTGFPLLPAPSETSAFVFTSGGSTSFSSQSIFPGLGSNSFQLRPSNNHSDDDEEEEEEEEKEDEEAQRWKRPRFFDPMQDDTNLVE